jgi:glucan-binding YG repeat protein
MRKQTKIAAIVSAAALLAIGASMTSFAATGWQEEDGTWVYYNRAEEKVTDKWAKSGDNWFYLDGDGYMATDMLIEDDDDYYYVDANGAMVRNQWIAIDNEDAGNDDDEPEVHWYYFQNNGKAYRKKGSTSVFKKSINGKTYCFNEDGQMQYGWVDSEGQTDYEDDAWSSCEYYFGDENDGAMSVGWRLISIVDEDNAEDLQPGDAFWDEDQDRWFWFKSSGKKQTSKDNKTINGKKYGFDEDGRMIADWYTKDATPTTATASQGHEKYTETFMYFSTPEDGARYTKGWFKVVPGYYLHESKYEDGDNYWYYADGKGHIVASEIKTIKSKKYLFDNYGRMKKGLQFVDFGVADETKEVAGVYADDDYGKYSADFYGYDTEDNFDKTAKALASKLQSGEVAFMFFSNDEDHDGSMKTGKQSINIDGDSFTFKFYTSGARKGQGISGVDDKKIYMGGKMIAADSDEKINFYVTDAYTGSDFEKGDKITIAKLIKEDILKKDTSYDKKDETKYILDTSKMTDAEFAKSFVCVNTSGSILTSGTKKDGDDYKIHLEKVAGGAVINGKTINTSTIKYVILK